MNTRMYNVLPNDMEIDFYRIPSREKIRARFWMGKITSSLKRHD